MRRGGQCTTHKRGSIAGTTKREQWDENERRLESERHDSGLMNPFGLPPNSTFAGAAAELRTVSSGAARIKYALVCMLNERQANER